MPAINNPNEVLVATGIHFEHLGICETSDGYCLAMMDIHDLAKAIDCQLAGRIFNERAFAERKK
jgi:hypothetical protein